ncbi:DUF6884 domain-containing protein [Komagataeibacter melaceti]|nr:DUF6884 domain-containing protein [Komagataeibacter melaceti]
MSPTAPLHLIACVKRKASGPMRAADLYQSPWFRKARAYVEAQGAPWYVLSALHGLVVPDDVIAPYEQTLMTMLAADRRAWGERVVSQLVERGHSQSSPIILLAGARYRQPLASRLGPRAIVPMAGLGIGKQLAWLSDPARLTAPYDLPNGIRMGPDKKGLIPT